MQNIYRYNEYLLSLDLIPCYTAKRRLTASSTNIISAIALINHAGSSISYCAPCPIPFRAGYPSLVATSMPYRTASCVAHTYVIFQMLGRCASRFNINSHATIINYLISNIATMNNTDSSSIV